LNVCEPEEAQFEGNNTKVQRLEAKDADYVECLHTSMDCYGTMGPYCYADFYANFGWNQPGCSTDGMMQKLPKLFDEVTFQDGVILNVIITLPLNTTRRAFSHRESSNQRVAEVVERHYLNLAPAM
jgi:hypothetical protein